MTTPRTTENISALTDKMTAKASKETLRLIYHVFLTEYYKDDNLQFQADWKEHMEPPSSRWWWRGT